MATAVIEVDEQVAAVLRAQAEARQLPLTAFLQQIAEASAPVNLTPSLTEDEWNRAIDEVSGEFPVLGAEFSRADIYRDHD